MYTLSNKIGVYSSLLIVISFAAWIICFTLIAVTSPLFYWTNLQDYLEFVDSNSQVFQNIARFFMLIFGPAWVVFITAFYDHVAKEKKVLIRLSLLFGIAFSVLSSINYFAQLSAVRLNILHGDTSGLEHFVQANPNSMMTAMTMLGWTLFLGLSSLFMIPIFKKGNRVSRIIKIAFLLNGISALIAGVGYTLQINVLTFLFINLGVGGAVITAAIASIIWFRREGYTAQK
jgi:hypothetical protein